MNEYLIKYYTNMTEPLQMVVIDANTTHQAILLFEELYGGLYIESCRIIKK
jgi:hypothetical protein